MFAATTGEGEAEPAARDVFSRIAARPQELLFRAITDAQAIASGPAIQARCLECPSPPMARPKGERSLITWLWSLVGA